MDGDVTIDERITVTIEDGVADVRLVRTDKMNALDDAMFAALGEAGERLKSDRSIRAAVLSGEGRAFCAGLDMGNFGRMAEGPRGQSTVAEFTVSDVTVIPAPKFAVVVPCEKCVSRPVMVTERFCCPCWPEFGIK